MTPEEMRAREEELIKATKGDATLRPLIREVVHIESELDRIRELPKLKTDPKNPERQKATPAAKLYKELLQQYTNAIKILIRTGQDDQADEESPLRKWLNSRC